MRYVTHSNSLPDGTVLKWGRTAGPVYTMTQALGPEIQVPSLSVAETLTIVLSCLSFVRECHCENALLAAKIHSIERKLNEA